MLRSSIIMCLLSLSACAADPGPAAAGPDRLVVDVPDGTVTSLYVPSGIEATLADPSSGAMLAQLTWDTQAGTADLSIAGGGRSVTMESDVEPSLASATQALSTLFTDYRRAQEPHAVGGENLLGCGCYWSPYACSGGSGAPGAVTCCCFWSDICSTACY